MLLLHIGDHTGSHVHELLAHMFGPAHLGMAVVAAALAVWAYRRARRITARAPAKRDRKS